MPPPCDRPLFDVEVATKNRHVARLRSFLLLPFYDGRQSGHLPGQTSVTTTDQGDAQKSTPAAATLPKGSGVAAGSVGVATRLQSPPAPATVVGPYLTTVSGDSGAPSPAAGAQPYTEGAL